MQMESVSCIFCGNVGTIPYLIREDLNVFVPGEFILERCTQCGLVFQNPRPASSSLPDIYPDSYDQYLTTATFTSPLTKWDKTYGLRKQANAVINHIQSGKILDVGCGPGNFLAYIQNLPGWEAVGIEPNKTASEYARSHLGLNIITSSLEDVNFPDNEFDVITLWNVIEHLSNPLESLIKLRRWIKPRGLLVFNTPNLDSLDARIFNRYWIGYELPRHFYVFSSSTITRLVERAGYDLLESRCIYGGHSMAMSSARFWLRSGSLYHHFGYVESAIENFLFSRVTRLLTAPYFYLIDRLKLSTSLNVFCSPSEAAR
jgi:SAM-dependent methyltransferase